MNNLIDLDKEVVASGDAPVTKEYGLIPKGNYTLRLLEVSDWKERTLRNVKVIKYDDSYKKVKDGNGNDVVTVQPSLTIHEANLKFEILNGDYKGRWIFHRVNTHPNRPWEIPSLLNALGVPSVKLSKLNTLVGKTTGASIDKESYMKKIVDDETGMENEVPVEYNVIKRFNRLAEMGDDDLDI